MADMKFMPLYKDTLSAMSRLNYEERGRLVTAMLEYFFEDQDPEQIATGKESMLLDLMVARLDENKRNAQKLSETRRKARLGTETNDINSQQMISNDIKSQQNEQLITNDIKCGHKEKEKEKEKDKEIRKEPIDIYIGDIKGEFKGGNNRVLADSGLTDKVKETLQDFIKMRKSIKKPMTDYAVKLLIGRLKKLSTDEQTQISILEQSIFHSWQDVYALKDDSGGGYAKSRDKPYNAATDYQQRDYSDSDLDKFYLDLSGGSG